VQEKSGVIVLDKQAEALITGAAMVRAQISEREVQLKVLRTAATPQNPDVIRLNSELRALRSELARMESAQGGANGSAVDMPVGRIPEAAIEYVRARRELKIQETLLESMIRQFEIAKLDEAKEGPRLQQVDVALPPDRKSKPSRALIVLGERAARLPAGVDVGGRASLPGAGPRDPIRRARRPGTRWRGPGACAAARASSPERLRIAAIGPTVPQSSTSPRTHGRCGRRPRRLAFLRDVDPAGSARAGALAGDVACRGAARADQPLRQAGVEAAGDGSS
jgi:hypothetical protein